MCSAQQYVVESLGIDLPAPLSRVIFESWNNEKGLFLLFEDSLDEQIAFLSFENYETHFLASGCNDRIYDLTLFHGIPYAVGSFSECDGISVLGIAQFNGVAWLPLFDWGLEMGEARCLVSFNDTSLYAGGSFHYVGGDALQYLARYDGVLWSAVDDMYDFQGNVLDFEQTRHDSLSNKDTLFVVHMWFGDAYISLFEDGKLIETFVIAENIESVSSTYSSFESKFFCAVNKYDPMGESELSSTLISVSFEVDETHIDTVISLLGAMNEIHSHGQDILVGCSVRENPYDTLQFFARYNMSTDSFVFIQIFDGPIYDFESCGDSIYVAGAFSEKLALLFEENESIVSSIEDVHTDALFSGNISENSETSNAIQRKQRLCDFEIIQQDSYLEILRGKELHELEVSFFTFVGQRIYHNQTPVSISVTNLFQEFTVHDFFLTVAGKDCYSVFQRRYR